LSLLAWCGLNLYPGTISFTNLTYIVMDGLSPVLLSTLSEIERYACLIRATALDVHLEQQLSPSEYKHLLNRYVLEFNFLVEKLYEQDTIFLTEKL
jgi:hypothetical protein